MTAPVASAAAPASAPSPDSRPARRRSNQPGLLRRRRLARMHRRDRAVRARILSRYALKYLWRHRQKNGREDLVKALWYLEREIAKRGDVAAQHWSQRSGLIHVLEACHLRTAAERMALAEIACGNASKAKRLVEQIMAEEYAPAAGDVARQPEPRTFATDPATGQRFEIHPQT